MSALDIKCVLDMVTDSTLDRGVRCHLARALRRAVNLQTAELLDKFPNNPSNGMSRDEIRVGKTEGKIPAIRLVRDRLNLQLIDAKRLVEDTFTRKGYTFFVRNYNL